MHVISKKKLKEFWEDHPLSKVPLEVWFKLMRRGSYGRFADLQTAFSKGKVDKVGKYTVFDVGGNKYRVITVLHYNRGKAYLRKVLTHAEYDKEAWKRQ